jgi:hypothetical protein
MVPGMFHCTGDPVPSDFDAITPLINWLKNGEAPESIKAYHLEDGEVKYALDLFPN